MAIFHHSNPDALLPILRRSDESREMILLWDFLNSGYFARFYEGGVEVFQVDTTGKITLGSWGGTAIPVNKGGTGATTAAGAIANLGGLTWVTAPAHFNSPGTAGQVAYDGVGNFYYCYTTNLWGKVTGSLSAW